MKIPSFEEFLLEFKSEDKLLMQQMSDYFTLAVEYEICSTEEPDEEPPIEDVEEALETIRELIMLDISRGKVGYVYTSDLGFTQKWAEKFVDKILKKVDDDDEDWTLNDLLDNGNYKLEKEKTLIDIIYKHVKSNLFEQNMSYLKEMVDKHLPNFYKKYGKTFKYELEGDWDKKRILEFSPKTYVKGLDAMIEQLNDFFDDWEAQDYWEFNNRTALHVNIGVKDRNIKWNPFKGLVLLSDMNREKRAPFVFKGIDWRLANRFCGSMLDAILKNLKGQSYKTKDKIADTNLAFRNKKAIAKHKEYLLSNIDKLDMHNMPQMEDFFNSFLVKANYEYYIKEFAVKLAEIAKGYVEFRYVGGAIDRQLIIDKILYFCYITYVMTNPEYKKEQYHKRAYKYIEEIKSTLLNQE